MPAITKRIHVSGAHHQDGATGFFAVRGPASGITVPQKVSQRSSGQLVREMTLAAPAFRRKRPAHEHKGETIGGRAFAYFNGLSKNEISQDPLTSRSPFYFGQKSGSLMF